jgi:hypothetical protein
MTNITEIVKRVQKKLRVEVDGIDGQETWGAIAKALGIDPNPPPLTYSGKSTSPIGDELASIAESQLGTEEDSARSTRGDAILKYQRSTSLQGQGWPWCAAFVDWCVEQLLAKHPEFSRKLPRPQTAAAFGLIDWGKEQHCVVFTPGANSLAVQRGDLVVFNFSHCGIVADADNSAEVFHSIEGNSNVDGAREGYEVVRHARNFEHVKNFIRLPEVVIA